MPWAKDVNLGTSGTSLTCPVSTGAAAGAWIFYSAQNFGSGVLTSVSNTVNPLTWTVIGNVANGSVRASMARAYAPAGVPSGNIVGVMSGSPGEIRSGAISFLGSSGDSLQEGSTVTATGSGTAWTASPVPTSDDALIVSAGSLNTNSNTTVTAPSVEDLDWQFSGSSCAQMSHRFVLVAGATPIAGTWGASNTWAMLAAAFSLAEDAPELPNPRPAPAGMFSPELDSRAWF